MSDFFTLELDTTGPVITILSPTYTSKETNNEIIILSNEILGNKQNFFFIDSLGSKHEAIFLHQGDKFVGSYRFNNFPSGFATLYATVEDEVGNPSNTETFSINVFGDGDVKVNVGIRNRKTSLTVKYRPSFIKSVNRKTKFIVTKRDNIFKAYVTNVSVSLEVVPKND